MAELDQVPDVEIAAPEVAAPAPEANEPDLDALISGALDKMDGTEGAPDESDTSLDRDERGRFKAKESAPVDGTSEANAESVSGTETPTNAKADPKWTDGHFRGWSQEERERFAKLPPEAQDVLMTKLQGVESHYKAKDTEYGQFRKSAEPLVNVIQEQRQYFDSIGIEPAQAVKFLVNSERTLRFGTYEQKTALFQQMARDYGIPVQIAEPDPYAADPMSPGSTVYPVIHDLRSELERLKGEVNSYKSRAEQQTEAQARQSLEAFQATKNADGSPAYPFMDAVKGTMAQLLSSGQATSLADAYALAAKPITDAMGQQLKARGAAEQKAKADAIAKARKAAPVRTSGMSPGGQTKAVDLDALISSALDSSGIH